VTGPDPGDEDAARLAAESLADRDVTGWFERLYAAAEEGDAVVPWDRGAPHRLLVEWAREHRPDAAGLRGIVVGCGLGDDAELVAGLGFDTVAFDVSPTAIRTARRRHPDSPVHYRVANLLDPPDGWQGAFDLVVESLTVQSLPDPPRPVAIANVASLVAPGGTLLVIASARDEGDPVDGPPWPLTRDEIDAFAAGGLDPVRIEDIPLSGDPSARRWRAEFRRPERGG
jgi:SAM-dependent methyltransferase